MVANVPRVATKAIETPRAPPVPAGCPFSASWAGQSVLDPAVQGSTTAFNPDRWLDKRSKASLKLHQTPSATAHTAAWAGALRALWQQQWLRSWRWRMSCQR